MSSVSMIIPEQAIESGTSTGPELQVQPEPVPIVREVQGQPSPQLLVSFGK